MRHKFSAIQVDLLETMVNTQAFKGTPEISKRYYHFVSVTSVSPQRRQDAEEYKEEI